MNFSTENGPSSTVLSVQPSDEWVLAVGWETAEHHDVQLANFVLGIQNSTETNGLFSINPLVYPDAYLFHNGAPMGSGGRSLFLRDLYEDLTANIFHEWVSGRSVLLTGTPGTGKSSYRNLLCKRIKAMPLPVETRRKIILQQGDERCWFVIEYWRTDVHQITFTAEMHYRFCSYDLVPQEIDIYYLIDINAEGSREIAPFNRLLHHVVCFTSPGNRFPWQLKDNKAITLYMPLWRREELIAAAQALNLDITEPGRSRAEVVSNRFDIFGGIARYVLEDDKNHYISVLSRYTPQEVGALNLHRIWPVAGCVIQLDVPRKADGILYDFRQLPTPIWASQRLVLQVAQVHTVHLTTLLLQVPDAILQSLNDALMTQLYSGYTLHLIAGVGLRGMIIRKLGKKRKLGHWSDVNLHAVGPVGEENIQYLTDTAFLAALATAPPSALLVPVSRTTAFTAVTAAVVLIAPAGQRVVLFVQHTIRPPPTASSQTAAVTAELQRLVGAAGVQCAVVYLVPSPNYGAFEMQDVGGADVAQFKMTVK